ncbi:NusG domain II-containing protein [uncultured Subdoligranulum sp.]|uniref:NusG domain II-containing protein n=1 Tax=uncultured Subdoligranulum sp. TaxID=512298 RepID=UPI0025CE3A52|nr:NusG domain II-containing protein [uncultured Subdoligranulum sp.]
MKRTTRNNLIFLLAVGAVIAALWLAGRAAPRRTGAVALVQYGDAGAEQRIPLAEDGVYQIDTGYYTIRLQVEDGGIRFVDSPCPDHLCEGFGVLRRAGDWAACLPARASVTILEE